MELLIGCGHNKNKQVDINGMSEWNNLITLDINADCKPSIVYDLEKLPLPFKDNTFDEIHAYQILEHIGQQGDWKFFFDQFSDFARILKPGGLFYATVPVVGGAHAWSDPGHKRAFPLILLAFLSQDEYTRQSGKTSMTDYRFYYKDNFKILQMMESGNQGVFVLQVIK